MLRRATPHDIEACLAMCRCFYDESGLREQPYDESSMRVTLDRLMGSEGGLLLLTEVDGALTGMAAALAYPSYFNGLSVAQELFWWVRPERRGTSDGVRLLKAIEEWAKDRGCVSLTMICLPIESPAESVYQRCGYRACERSYIKEL